MRRSWASPLLFAFCHAATDRLQPTEDDEVRTDQYDHAERQDADVQGVEARERMVAVVRSADRELLDVIAKDGDVAGDIGGDARRPVTLLVPRQEVAGQAQSQGQR